LPREPPIIKSNGGLRIIIDRGLIHDPVVDTLEPVVKETVLLFYDFEIERVNFGTIFSKPDTMRSGAEQKLFPIAEVIISQ
jgi:hypothetical protein